jgi:predicted RNase H-like HicB family nuclease
MAVGGLCTTGEEEPQLIREGIQFHLEEMRKEGLAAPEASSNAECVEVAAAH